jgi:anti-sigma regulatory factor (Ser/Thr protein kinase)
MSSSVEALAHEVGHVAHFYDAVDDHVDQVADFLAPALSSGTGVLVVAGPVVTQQLHRALAVRDIDIDEVTDTGMLVVVDAEALLTDIRQASPSLDLDKFDAVVRAAIRRATRGGRLRVYGELVNLLWEAGDVQGAIDIEDGWIRLAGELEFSLMCGYHAQSMRADQIDGFHDLCSRHQRVIGSPPRIDDAERGRSFPGSPAALRPARQFVAEALSDWGLEEMVDDAMLVVGELATNAVTHALSGFNVALARSDCALRLSVSDASQVVPRSSKRTVHGIGGHGMHVVAQLSSACGHHLVAGGKVVWADLNLRRSQQIAG